MARQITFAFERQPSPIFGEVYRPVALAEFWSQKIAGWVRVAMLVDTGADYTLLPHIYASDLGIKLDHDAQAIPVLGIGGQARVYLVRRWAMRLGPWPREIPVGFFARNDVPPVLGWHACLDTFKVTLAQHSTTFSSS